MISFTLKLSTGPKFDLNENPNDTFHNILNRFILNQCPKNINLGPALFGGNLVDRNKTLIENKITQGSVVVIKADVNLNIPPINNRPILKIPPAISNIQNNNKFLARNLTLSYLNNNNFNNTFFNPFPKLTNQNPYLIKFKNFLLYESKVPYQLLDDEGNCLDNSWRIGKKSGPPEYLKNYYSPQGWFAIGLKVFNLYDNGDNTWLGMRNKKGEWLTAYHPIKSINSINSILINGFRKGPFQKLEYFYNINPLTNHLFPKCGKGVYFNPDINIIKMVAKTFNYLGNIFKIALMCRINPYAVRIAKLPNDVESWIVNGDELNDPYGRRRDNEVRPYRILFFIEK